jgi:hypothetical protein
MRSSNKSRSRKNSNMNRRGNTGNIVNRVFDSAGPEGKVRGTPQQIIEKYQALAHDAQMSGDRIGSENFAQHAEHYARLLGNAQREIAERREAQEAQRKEAERKDSEKEEVAAKARAKAKEEKQQDSQEAGAGVSGDELLSADGETDSNLVQTPENSQPEPAKKPSVRKRKAPTKAAAVEVQAEPGQEPVIN